MSGTRQFGRYEILEQLGKGGFATAYKARDSVLDRFVALKVLSAHWAEDPDFVERFQNEARASAKLRHPNIVTIFDTGEEAGRLYIAMEYLDGRTLDSVLEEEGALPLERSVRIIELVASALDYAHGQGILHRDIKPSNIILEENAWGETAKLLDFGLVKAMEKSAALTTTGSLLGTPAYMSPEQIHGDEVLDNRSDIYSLGVVLYELLTGQPPYLAETPTKQMMKHLLDPVPDILAAQPVLPEASRAVVETVLAKERVERYESGAAFVVALDTLIEGPAVETIAAPVLETSDKAVESAVEEAETGTDEDSSGLSEVAVATVAAVVATDDEVEEEPDSGQIADADSQHGAAAPQEYFQELLPVPKDNPRFYLAAFLVSNELYMWFVKANPSWHPAEGTKAQKLADNNYLRHWRNGRPREGDLDLPVTHINVHAAEAFAAWLGDITRTNVRLPTLKEWTFAVQAGRVHWLTEELNAGRINYFDISNKLTPVKALDPNPFGIHDLLGNAYDMCVDGDDETAVYYLAGGCYSNSEAELRAKVKAPSKIESKTACSINVSFRCVYSNKRKLAFGDK